MKRRNLVTNIILSLVTCNIYGVVWSCLMAKNITMFKDPTDSGILDILLMIFLPPAGMYLVEKKFTEGCAAKGIEHKDNTVIYLIMSLFMPTWYVAMAMMQSEINKLAAE